MNIIAYNLSKRGMDHDNNCEDSSLSIILPNGFVFNGVFDGCSSGKESHVASSLMKRISLGCIFRILKNTNTRDTQLILYTLFCDMYSALVEFVHPRLSNPNLSYSEPDEFLSTLILSITDMQNGKSSMLLCGDGLVYLDEDSIPKINVHNDDGTVMYLSTLIRSGTDVKTCYREYSYGFTFDLKSGISLCTDGILTYRDKFGRNRTEDAVNSLIISRKYQNCDNMLIRSSRILENSDDCIRHADDVSVSRLIIV